MEKVSGFTGFSGTDPWDRALAASYPNARIGEDITHRGAPAAAVDDWINSVYHRFAILRPDLSVMQLRVSPAGTTSPSRIASIRS